MADESPAEVKHVHDISYISTCSQCGSKARGSFRELIDGGWVVMPAGQVAEGPTWFCPSCVTGLAPA